MAAGHTGRQALKFLREGHEHFVAVQMTMAVVRLLEVIDIHQHERESLTALCSLKLTVDRGQRTAIADAGKRIAGRKALKLLVAAFQKSFLMDGLRLQQHSARHIT